jgi:uncharacterized protein
MMPSPAFAEKGVNFENPSLRAIDLTGPAGRLEAILNAGAPEAICSAVVCHPHPLGGGTMHNKVVYHAMKVLNSPEWGFRWPVLRFNFRGNGLSSGSYDGRAETGDVLAALSWLKAEYRKPIVAVGFSFGAAMASIACCDAMSRELRMSLIALVALGLPTQGFGYSYRYPCLSNCTLPKLFLSGDRDSFAPAEELKQLVDDAALPKKLVFVSDADHMFTGQIESMQKALFDWLKEHVQ